MPVTDYSALTHCFFYSTVWLTEKVRKSNVTQHQELPLSDPTTAAASRAKLGKSSSLSHQLCYNTLPYLSISYRLLMLLYILVLTLGFTAIVLYTSDQTAANPEAGKGAAPAPNLHAAPFMLRVEQELTQGSSNFRNKHTQHQSKYPRGGWESTIQHCTGSEPFRGFQSPQKTNLNGSHNWNQLFHLDLNLQLCSVLW